MPAAVTADRHIVLTAISDTLHAQFGVIVVLNQPADEQLTFAARHLSDAIDRIDVAAEIAYPGRAA